MPRFNLFASTLMASATLAMAATPVAAAEMPVSPLRGQQPAATVFKSDDVNADGYRRYRHRDRVDAGDVIAGVLILGGIAAVASAASRSSRDRDYRNTRYPSDYRYRTGDSRVDYRGNTRSNAGSGIDNAVNMCVGAIERDVRVASVDGVDRSASGWLVTGSLYNGEAFSCRIDGSGRIDGIDYGRGAAAPYSGATVDRQWDDERYRAAWANLGGTGYTSEPLPSQAQAQLPAYPGGPLPGDLTDE